MAKGEGQALRTNVGRWFKCRGCGLPIGLIKPNEHPDLMTGAVIHAKGGPWPIRVECTLYHQLDAAQLWTMHEKDAEIEAPSSLTQLRTEVPS